MYGGIAPTSPLTYGLYLRGKDQSGNIVQLIGVNPTSGKVQIDPLAVGANFGGNVLLQDPAAYLNWDTIVGALGYGIRANAGTIEFCNSGGAWAPIAAAAASAGGWTDDGTVVRLDTGSDTMSVGSATPATSRFYSSAAAGNIFNDNGADIDFRVESDTNANHFWSDAGAFGGVGAFGFGAVASQASTFITIDPPALTVGANLSMARLFLGNAGVITVPTGTAAVVASLYIQEPNISATGTVSDAYTVFINGAPTEGTRNGALWVTGGEARFDAGITGLAAAGLVVNESGADVDFRIESDTNANHFWSDAGANSGGGAFGFGNSVSALTNVYVYIAPPAISVPGNSSFFKTYIGGGTVTVGAGTSAEVATLRLAEPDIVATGTVSDAYTVIIATAPTEGTRNGALWVGAGQVRFSGMPTAAAGLPAGTLWNNSGVVNIV